MVKNLFKDLWFITLPILFFGLWIFLVATISAEYLLVVLNYLGMILRILGFIILLFAINDQLKHTDYSGYLGLLKELLIGEKSTIKKARGGSESVINIRVGNIDSHLEPIINENDSDIDILNKKYKSLKAEIKNSKNDIIRILEDSEKIVEKKIEKIKKEVEKNKEELKKITQKNFRREIFGVLIIIDGFLFMNLTEDLMWLTSQF